MKKYFYTNDRRNGLDLVCNKCGETVHLKRLRGHEYVGVRLVPEVYEDVPNGWSTTENGDFCPECSAKIE